MGMWLPWLELGKLDTQDKGFGDLLKQALASPRHKDLDRPALNCPNCHEPMHRHLCNEDKGVSIDECYDCGGIFLDSGELEDIREHHMSESEREAYANKLIANIPEYQGAMMNLEREQDRARGLQRFAHFVMGSSYTYPDI